MVRLRTLSLAATLAAITALGASAVQAQTGRTSVCKDGTTSNVSGRGACSSHGGVNLEATRIAKEKARLAEEARHAGRKTKRAVAAGEVKVDRAEEKASAAVKADKREMGRRRGEDNEAAGAIAQCKDGMYSHAKSTRGACSRHGGIARKL